MGTLAPSAYDMFLHIRYIMVALTSVMEVKCLTSTPPPPPPLSLQVLNELNLFKQGEWLFSIGSQYHSTARVHVSLCIKVIRMCMHVIVQCHIYVHASPHINFHLG